MRRRYAALLALAAALVGCQDHEFHPPDREARVAEADSLFSPAAFDSLTWASDSVRTSAGNLVYADECRRCHGPLGRGDTEYAETQELEVPSLVREDWELGQDMEAVRQRIFSGHPEGMPSWGVGKLSPRQIDAVAFYIVEQLRPEVIGGDRTLPGG